LSTFIDDVYLGQVRYGDQEMTGYNANQIIFTKRPKFSWESEIRAVISSYDPVGGQARNHRETNFPHREPQDDLKPMHQWVHEEKRRRIALKDLIISIAVSPWAGEETFNEVKQSWAKIRSYNFPVAYDLKSACTPTVEELKRRGWGKPGDCEAD
jgi:hypothetical protein